MHNHPTLFRLRPWSNSILPELAAFFKGDAGEIERFVRAFANTRFVCPDLGAVKVLQAESNALDLVRQDAGLQSQLAICRDSGLSLERLREIYAADAGEPLARWEGAGDPVAAATDMAAAFPRQAEDIAVLFDFRGRELRDFYVAIGRNPPAQGKKRPTKRRDR